MGNEFLRLPRGNVVPSLDFWTKRTFTPPAKTDLLTAERAIVAQLKENIAPNLAEVVAFPSDWKNYRMMHQSGAVLVRFMGSDYNREQPTDIVAQRRTMDWAVFCVMRQLGWGYGGEGDKVTGAYTILELVRRALTGWKMNGFDKAFPVREEYIAYYQGFWVYEARYSFITTAVEICIPESFPTLTTFNAFESAGQTLKASPTAEFIFNGIPQQINLAQQNVSNVVISDISSSAVFSPSTDYSVDTVSGIVTALTGGTIPENAAVNVSFSYADVVTELASGGQTPSWPTN